MHCALNLHISSVAKPLSLVDLSDNRFIGLLPSCLNTVVKISGNCFSIDSRNQHPAAYCKEMDTRKTKSTVKEIAKDYGRKNGDESGSSGSGIGVKFFKIVSNPGAHKLRLPPDFTRRYGHNLPDRVYLELPNGLVWKVELIHSNREAWLQGGWQRFEEYYSTQFGHFLLFEYNGDSHFKVNIFDTSAMEIEYSYYDSLERDAGTNQVAETEVVECDSDDSVDHRSDIELKYPDWKQAGDGGNNKFKAYARALAFMSGKPTKNPFTIVVMHPSYVSTGHSAMHLPPAFAKEILDGMGNSSILLVFERKTWQVRCICRKRGASFTSGWRKFAEDNDLKVGDACVFEVPKKINTTWEVIIFRG